MGSISGQVRYDVDGDGDLSDADNGIPGASVGLWTDPNGDGSSNDGVLASSATTASDGRFSFGALGPGSYLLIETDPAGHVSSGDSAGPNNNAIPATLTPGATSAGHVFLDTLPVNLSGRVWEDRDQNGLQGGGEPGIAGVLVTLYDSAGNPAGTTRTGADGVWAFANLAPGNYSVGFSDAPAGYLFTTSNNGNDSLDSDVDPSTGRTGLIALLPGDNNASVGAGLVANPTAVTLRSFTANWRGNAIDVRWETMAEFNSLGFYVYRSVTGSRADAVHVTPSLILARGRGQGGSAYAWLDPLAQPGTPCSYWLVEVEASGLLHEYGPANASTTAAAYTAYLPIAVP